MLLAAALPLGAATPERRAFEAAAQAFQGGFWERAENEFDAFVQKFPAAPEVPEAILFQAEARIERTNYAGAIELLTNRMAGATNLVDQYLFWIAEAHSRKGDYQAAAETFARLVKEHPGSVRRVWAVIGEATARSRLGDWPRVIDSLRQTNGAFLTFASANPGSELATRGFLLLSEAHLAREDCAGALDALRPLANASLPPDLEWKRQHLLCRIHVAEGKLDQALQSSSNLLAAASRAAQPALQATSVALQAGLLEQLGRPEDALAVYRLNLAAGVPAERQRQALLKSTELYLAKNRLPEAADLLEQVLAGHSKSSMADLALLTLGELRLRQFITAPAPAPDSTNATAAVTNFLDQAQTALVTLTTNFPKSSLTGKAQLNLGWCYYLQNRLPESRTAFTTALGHLAPSLDLATAYFKLGDIQLQLRDYTNALNNYRAIVEQLSKVPEVRSNLLERALYQTVRAATATGDLSQATNALAQILAEFPNGFHADRALLLAGGEVGRRGNPAAAREMYEAFLKIAPSSDLLPKVRLAIARTYEQENDWKGAIGQYDAWLGSFTNHADQARAEFFRAQATFQAGQETNALTCFTNFITRFATNEFTPLAQLWVADYHFRHGNFPAAEMQYRSLFKSWPASELTYQAQMMAGRAAMARQGWSDAAECFTSLYNETNLCPTDLRVQALFAYGDYWMSRDSTNKLADYREAISTFTLITRLYPTNRLAPLAWGQMALCYWQWAQTAPDPESVTNALNSFQQVIDSTQATAAARSIAKVGLGVVLEQLAQHVEAGQTNLRTQALNHYLDVFYDKVLRGAEQPDLFWKKEAGLRAAHVAEELGDYAGARNVYVQLQEWLPFLRSRFENKIKSLRSLQQAAAPPG